MKLKFEEDPRAWRKITWLSVGALTVITSFLRWRRILPVWKWEVALAGFAAVAIAAALRPQGFRSYYRFSQRVGFYSSEIIGRIVLALVFIIIITPAGLVMRALGKDPLRLKRSPDSSTFWQPAKENNPLDRMY